MMAFVHGFFLHLPNWLGFLMLVGVWIVFRGILLRWRRGTMERMRMGGMPPMPPPVAPVVAGQVRCPRCSASAPSVAAFCPKCGLALNSLPPPIVQRQYPRPTRSPWLLLIYILLGVIGLAAFAYWRSGGWDDENSATEAPPPEIRHTHTHDYHWSH